MEVKDLLQRLQSFGLDEGESIVYYQLCRLGGARAAEVASAAKRKRPDTYRILDNLVIKGFAEKTLERPVKYVPIEIETALQRLLEARAAEVESMQEESKHLSKMWPKAHAAAGPTNQRFTVYQGKEQVRGLIGRMLESAQDEVILVATPGGLANLGIRAFLNEVEGNTDVRMRLMTKPEARNQGSLAGLEQDIEIRYAELPSYHQMLIVDAKQIALFVSGGRKLSTQGEEETVLWLNTPDFVLAQKALFDAVWATGLAHAEWMASQEEDRLPAEARLMRGRWQRIDRMRRMIGRAEQRIWIDAPAIDVARWQRTGVLRDLQRRAKHGADVWVWTDGPLEAAGIHVIKTVEPAPTMEVLVDGRESMVVFGASDGGGQVAYDAEWATWSTHPDQVAALDSRFAGKPQLLTAE